MVGFSQVLGRFWFSIRFWADFCFCQVYSRFGCLVQCLGMGFDILPVFGQLFWFLSVFFDCWT